MYKFLKPILFLFDPERVHHKVTGLLQIIYNLPFGPSLLRSLYGFEHPGLEKNLLGLHFKNPVGLAAGFDKNGAWIDALACLGFGFVEVGTVTPRPQEGNPKPRLFRLIQDRAILNRMGFNNDGVAAMVENLKKVKNKDIIIGGNIGKNKNTDNENAIHDYVICFEKLYEYVHYFVINVSSPNTPGLRELQEKEPLTAIINELVTVRDRQTVYKPILLKIAPDLTHSQLDDIIDITNHTALDGLVCTNTTLDRDKVSAEAETLGAGGISGAPVFEKSTEVLSYLRNSTTKPIIGVGGIDSAETAKEKVKAGADLLQVYTGFIYEGPDLLKKLKKALFP
ncbi:MAG: quinone-dependent dihydroorotate dehydrogenase [Saprospiraceae bacterium]|nr:quinone-dependent dihydroorotate dehydrogenase [Saprospiraceae bacterium]